MTFYTNIYSRGSKIYRRGYYRGKRIKDVINYNPYLFVLNSAGEYKTLDGRSARKKEFASMPAARDWIKKEQDVDNGEGKEFFGLTNYQYAFINDEYPDEIDYDPTLISVVSIDIETPTDQGFPDPQTAAVPISNISVSKNGEVVVFGTKFYKSKSSNVRYVMCKDERDLLTKFLILWNHEDWSPEIITGWNIEHFDIPYIVNRIGRVLGESDVKKLSPWGMVNEREIIRGKSMARAGKQIEQRVDKVYELVGISSLDYLELYKKFSFKNQESYKLDYIASVELNENKLDYSDYGSLFDLYEKNYDLFVDYNIHDVVLVDKLEDKLKLIEQVMAFAYDAKVNYNDTMTTVRPWDVIIHNYLLKQKIVIPQNIKHFQPGDLVGGYVKEPKIGMSKWVVSFDLNSLYPHLIMQYNISPETFVDKVGFPSIDYMLEGNWEYRDGMVAYAANGCTYRKDKQGFLPALMEKMYNDRVVYKEKMLQAKKEYEATKDPECVKLIARYHNMQLAKKIQLNSAYGALGNEFFRWFSFNNAEAITTSGQLSIRWIEKKINAFLGRMLKTDEDYVIASDTDSIYVNFGPLVEKVLKDKTDQEIVHALDEFVEAKIQPYIDKCYEELADMMNAREQKMKMKRETIANKGIWKAKKMYILNAWNVEGVQYEKPQLKIQGIEAVRSSTPAICRVAIKKGLELIMNKDEIDLQRFVLEFKNEYYSLPFEQIASPSGIKGIEKYRSSSSIFIDGTPMHVKAALMFNELLKKNKLKNIEPIKNGDKIKVVYLKTPNPIHNNAIASPDVLPHEFGLDKYIDREKQFSKTFLDPLTHITNTIGWDTEKKVTLDSFF
ncbi:PolB DNA polymerase elongation subunit (family B) [uncultured Caudovirales phage]|uniref:DNA polymerase n=1 Tax=uncultured Caudovirales phage TaxID=2100421 RepID=A0A6J5QBD1_9CAUD|nr:PolB DNA polymerase elongation subunit (family B) [uncultured Caudovirales phage]